MLSDGENRGALLRLGHVRAIERALVLRREGLPYESIATVMRLYHGAKHTKEYWRRACRDHGAPPVYHGSLSGLRSVQLYPVDHALLEALRPCPLTIAQLKYVVRTSNGRVPTDEQLDRSLTRLVEAGKITGHGGSGVRKAWRAL